MEKGKIIRWHDDKGWGLIGPDGSGERLFFHISAFQPKGVRPTENLDVIYVAGTDKKGRRCATAVKAPTVLSTRAARSHNHSRPTGKTQWPTLIGLLAALAAPLVAWRLSGAAVIGAAYAAMSLLSFVAYNLDKSKAEQRNWRTPESTLHVLDLLCGWPGGLLAQYLFRHKNHKSSFQFGFWITVAANIAALTYFHPQILALL